MAHAATAWSREPAATRRKDEMTRAMRCAAKRPSHTMATHPSSILLNQAASTRSARHVEHHGCAHATSSSCRPICSALRDEQRGHLPGRCLSKSQRPRAPCSARAQPRQWRPAWHARSHRGSANFARPETPKSDPRTTSEVGLTSEVIRGLPGLKCVVVEDIKSNLPEKSRSGSPRGNATWRPAIKNVCS